MTYEEGVDEILGVFKQVWDTTGYPVQWDDHSASVPSDSAPWARATVQHDSGGQSSLANADGAKLFANTGSLFVQIFTPIGGGLVEARQLAQKVVTHFSRVNSPVSFFRPRMRENGKSGAFQMTLVIVDFDYTDVR